MAAWALFSRPGTSLNRVVALKMIKSGELAGADEVRRFHVEAEAAASLDHPAIVPIYEVGQIDEQHFFSMGYVDGQAWPNELPKAHCLRGKPSSWC